MKMEEHRKQGKALLGTRGNALVNLTAAIAIGFIITKFIFVIYRVSGFTTQAYYAEVFDKAVLPAQLSKLASQCWSVITFMFIHDSVFSLIANIFWLWMFGYILQDLAGTRKLLPVFLYGSLVGAIVYVTAYYTIPVLFPTRPVASLYGAQMGVMAVVLTATTLSPNYRLFPLINGGIPLWILAITFVIIDFAGVGIYNPAYLLGHIAAGLLGFILVQQLRKGNDWTHPFNAFFDWLNNLFTPKSASSFRDKLTRTIEYPDDESEDDNSREITQSRIDNILDKINREGYNHLTEEEKNTLRRAAQEDEA